MAKHLADLRYILRPGAQLAYIVGDQKSFLQVMIRTGSLLADIAQGLGYEVVGIDLFRTRLSTTTKDTNARRSCAASLVRKNAIK
ncbi:hypothetical protein DSM106972_003610 [Dulcicalothrix desertica PCC 7102]|uniref:Methyltransferase type 11 domain-containing protein n=1 Tax=Dulcicalothrix desertica PCC 7102 TaxID=232991 RepID=A0A433VUT8_9CYAN|nr:hypothetical protein [Dulcicalothrix desertica]RUT09866.1 hypothetical protein DSM106972_003610 [Dulcicalothrix desertica PCC 7102]